MYEFNLDAKREIEERKKQREKLLKSEVDWDYLSKAFSSTIITTGTTISKQYIYKAYNTTTFYDNSTD